MYFLSLWLYCPGLDHVRCACTRTINCDLLASQVILKTTNSNARVGPKTYSYFLPLSDPCWHAAATRTIVHLLITGSEGNKASSYIEGKQNFLFSKGSVI